MIVHITPAYVSAATTLIAGILGGHVTGRLASIYGIVRKDAAAVDRAAVKVATDPATRPAAVAVKDIQSGKVNPDDLAALAAAIKAARSDLS